MTTNQIQESTHQPIPQISPYLSEIAHKKVKSVALSCFEAIAHWFLTVFSCFYPAYNNFYQGLLEQGSQIGVNGSPRLSRTPSGNSQDDGLNNPIAHLPAGFNPPRLLNLNCPGPYTTAVPEGFVPPTLLSNTLGTPSVPATIEIPPLPVQWTPEQDRALLTVFNSLLENCDTLPSKLKPNSSRGSLAQNAQAVRQWIHKNPQIPGEDARVLDKFTVLDLDGFDLTSLPPEINLLPNLRHVTISSSNITQLPDYFNPPKLKTLTIVNTPITKLPEGFNPPQLEWTEELELLCQTSGASAALPLPEITAMPTQPDAQEIKDRAIIRFFSMVTPQLQSTEECYPGTLPTLSGDVATDGQSIRDWIAKNPYDPSGYRTHILDTITELKLTLRIVEFSCPLPSEINQLKNLVKLEIDFDTFNELPDDFALPNLEILTLNGKFTQLPPSLNTHKKLRWLITYGSRIKKLSEEFNPENLERLSLASSLIEHLPPALNTHKKLNYLDIQNCPMKQFADNFNPENLWQLYFRHTPITQLPEACELQNLKVMTCDYHLLEKLPLKFEPLGVFNPNDKQLRALRDQQLKEREQKQTRTFN